MKKILSLVLALAVLMCASAFAETVTIGESETHFITTELPEGYTFVPAEYGDFIGGLYKPADPAGTVYYTFLIAFSEEYAEVFGRASRLNDLTEEQLKKAIAELTQDFAEPEVKVAETGLGTKVLIVNEQGSESEYATILTIYHGYFIQIYIDEITGRQLTDEEILTGLDIMTGITLVEK